MTVFEWENLKSNLQRSQQLYINLSRYVFRKSDSFFIF